MSKLVNRKVDQLSYDIYLSKNRPLSPNAYHHSSTAYHLESPIDDLYPSIGFRLEGDASGESGGIKETENEKV